MAWCRQATSHYPSQCWPRSLLPYGVIRPQWVNVFSIETYRVNINHPDRGDTKADCIIFNNAFFNNVQTRVYDCINSYSLLSNKRIWNFILGPVAVIVSERVWQMLWQSSFWDSSKIASGIHFLSLSYRQKIVIRIQDQVLLSASTFIKCFFFWKLPCLNKILYSDNVFYFHNAKLLQFNWTLVSLLFVRYRTATLYFLNCKGHHLCGWDLMTPHQLSQNVLRQFRVTGCTVLALSKTKLLRGRQKDNLS